MTAFYTYRIKWTSTGVSYYGVRYKRGGSITDLMTTYFTSSKYVHQYIELHGMPDVVQIRRTFTNALAAKQWEERVIDRAKLFMRPEWINRGNNGSFKNIVMDDSMREKIRLAKSQIIQKKYTMYNNGSVDIRVYDGDDVPEGFVRGLVKTSKRLAVIEKITNLSPDVRKRINEQVSLKMKGKPKPEGFGEKVSASSKGKPKPHMMGENNNAKREDVRLKISESWQHREPGVYFHKQDGEYIYVNRKDIDTVDSTIWKRGKLPTGKWYNDGINNIYVRNGDVVDTSNLQPKKLRKPFVVCNDGIKNLHVSTVSDIPEGFVRGRFLQLTKKGVIVSSQMV